MLAALACLQGTVRLFFEILQLMMFARAILSWIPGLSDNAFGDFLYTVTEWVIMPVRSLFDKMNWNNAMMFDIPFLVTFLLLSVISSII